MDSSMIEEVPVYHEALQVPIVGNGVIQSMQCGHPLATNSKLS